MNEPTHKYDDIIHLPHPVSRKHPRMSAWNRAAQFSPFAALTGHSDAIQETERLTDEWIELEEDQKTRLNEQLQILREHLPSQPQVEITFFKPDEKKSGGAYVTVQGRVKRLDEYRRRILFTDGTAVALWQISSIQGELF
ncbi:MAG: YolD-like family protein [Lachnospiraceae bacterium]|nr:YolD-like family protein [Lachnospiraceae bacterium]